MTRPEINLDHIDLDNAHKVLLRCVRTLSVHAASSDILDDRGIPYIEHLDDAFSLRSYAQELVRAAEHHEAAAVRDHARYHGRPVAA